MKKFLFLICSIILVTGCGKKNLTCKMSNNTSGMEMNSLVKVNFKDNKIYKVEVIIDAIVPDEYKNKKEELINLVKTSSKDDSEIIETPKGFQIKMKDAKNYFSTIDIDYENITFDELKDVFVKSGYKC